METVLAHKSSLELWSHRAALGQSLLSHRRDVVGAPARSLGKNVDASYWLARTPFLTEPLHIAVGTAAERRRGSRCVSHVVRQLGSKGSVWGEGSALGTVCPAMCLAQFAGELPLAQLVELACALSGSYRFAAKPEGVVTSAVPLASLRDMRAFLQAHPQMRGASQALRAVDLAVDCLGSPYETILYLLLCLPRKMGGYGFPKPLANSQLIPKGRDKRVVAQRKFYPDLLWPEKRLVVEYDSREHHSSPEQVEHDARRRNDLEAMGYHVVVANRSIVASATLFSQFADSVRRHLGMRSRKETAHCQENRARLRRLLLSPSPVVELWR